MSQALPTSVRPVSEYDALVLDCDGVILDGDAAFAAVFSELYARLGLPAPDYAERTRWSGPPLFDSAQLLIERESLSVSPQEIVDQVFTGLVRHKDYFEVFPGVLEALEALRAAAVPLAVATMKLWVEIDRMGFQHVPGLCTFPREAIFAPKDFADPTTKAALIAQAVAHLGVDPEAVLMVGDRISDVQGAHEVGVDAVGVTHTGTTEDDFRKAGALWVGPSLHAFVRTFLHDR